MSRFRKRPVVVEAVRWTGLHEDLEAVYALVDFDALPDDGVHVKPGIGFVPALGELEIPTLEGVMRASPGDWIIRGVQGEVYPCKPDIFEQTYEPVDGVVRTMETPLHCGQTCREVNDPTFAGRKFVCGVCGGSFGFTETALATKTYGKPS